MPAAKTSDWYWKPWFFDWGLSRPGVSREVTQEEATNRPVVLIDRLGTTARAGGIGRGIYRRHEGNPARQTALVWKDGKQQLRMPGAAGKKIKSAALGGKTIPDVDRKNNNWPR